MYVNLCGGTRCSLTRSLYKNAKLLFFFNYYFPPSSEIQRVEEGHPSVCLTNYKNTFLMVDCNTSSPLLSFMHFHLSCIFKSSFVTVYRATKAPIHSVVYFLFISRNSIALQVDKFSR